MRIVTYVFLRLYAFSLGRSFRNSPDSACDDAIMLTGMALIVPIVLVLLIMASFIPGGIDTFDKKNGISLFVVLICVVPLMYWLGQQFDSFRGNPKSADAYRGRRDRWITAIALVTFPVCTALGIGFLLHHFRS